MLLLLYRSEHLPWNYELKDGLTECINVRIKIEYKFTDAHAI